MYRKLCAKGNSAEMGVQDCTFRYIFITKIRYSQLIQKKYVCYLPLGINTFFFLLLRINLKSQIIENINYIYVLVNSDYYINVVHFSFIGSILVGLGGADKKMGIKKGGTNSPFLLESNN